MSEQQRSDQISPFIRHLFELRTREDRGALSELRRSLVSDNDLLAARHVLPWLGAGVGPRRESVALLLAGLFALHPEYATGDNFGRSMARVWLSQDKRPSTEQRFVALLNAHVEDLPYSLRQSVNLVCSLEIPVDWVQLYQDLCNWDHPDRFVQRKWARSFWGAHLEDES